MTLNKFTDWLRAQFEIGPLPEPAPPKIRAYKLAFASAAIYFIYLFLVERHWLLRDEMWAEAATSYYFKASSHDFWVKYFMTEAGYLPLVGRLIAALLNAFHTPAKYLPYLYNWSADLMIIVLISSFCLPRFRPLMPNDYMRFVLTLIFFSLLDFQTLSFINFSHCGIILCTALAALALISANREVEKAPWWAWLLLLFIISKPYYVCLFPIFIMGIVVANPSYRRLMTGWSIAVALQLAQLFASFSKGVLSSGRTLSMTVLQKIEVVVIHFFGFLGSMPPGHALAARIHTTFSIWWLTALGVVVFVIFCLAGIRGRGNVRALILCGFLLIGVTFMINVSGLTDQWNFSIAYLKSFWLYRHVLPIYFGFFFMLAACFTLAEDRWLQAQTVVIKGRRFAKADLAVAGIVVWYLASGWFILGYHSVKWPEFPYQGASSWEEMADNIDQKLYPLCVPVNPYPWRVKHGCEVLNVKEVPPYDAPMVTLSKDEEVHGWVAVAPKDVTETPLIGLELVVAPQDGTYASVIHGFAQITTVDGQTLIWSGAAHPMPKGVLYFAGSPEHQAPVQGVKSVRITFDRPVTILARKNAKGVLEPGLMWYGVADVPSLENDVY